MARVVAIDVAILLPPDVAEKAQRANSVLAESLSSFRFDETHLPHISLLHTYVKEDDLAESGPIKKKLHTLLSDLLDEEQFPLTIKGIATGPEFGPGVFLPSFEIEKNELLLALHTDVLTSLSSQYANPPDHPDSSAFFTTEEDKKGSSEPINKATSDYVRNFANNYALAKYFPHVTLGAGNKEAVAKIVADRSLNTGRTFQVPRIAVCQLGNYGTCRKIIFEFALRVRSRSAARQVLIPPKEEDDTPDFVPFQSRPEWAGVAPVPQDDGPAPVCPIAYSPQFTQTMDYFRAVLKTDERSERALRLTKEVIKLNPANYTAWAYRRNVLASLKYDLRREMLFVDKMAIANPKNYQLWYHRKALVEKLRDPSKELAFTALQLVGDSKNYHAWAHRQWVLESFSLWENELAYVDDLLKTDFRNNSAWNQRYFVISKTKGWTKEVRQAEIDYAFNFIRSAPNNQSSWNYLKGVVLNDRFAHYPVVAEKTRHFVQNFPGCIHAHSLLVDILEQEGTSAALDEAREVCKKLVKVDEMHAKYWAYRADTVSKK